VPSTDFAVKGIQGAEDGTANTVQARADLNANNEKLAARCQSLAITRAVLAVAKVVQVQSGLFASAVGDSRAAAEQLASTWGQPPVSPPGSGLSLGFYDFAKDIDAVRDHDGASDLVARLRLANDGWRALSDALEDMKQLLTELPQS
jgi:hypothetical protein